MAFLPLKAFARRFRDDTRGSVMVETVITLPLLVWAIAATYEFFEVHRYKAAREKATYTVADMLSRETATVTPIYLDNALTLFNEISNDDGVNQLCISIIHFDADINEYSVRWSEVRGSGEFAELEDSDVATSHATLPIMGDGIDLVLVKANSVYSPLFNVGLDSNLNIDSRIFTSIRFEPTVIFDANG